MNQFNLIDEKWIPMTFIDGSRDELGIRDSLLRSKDIAVIEGQSPLVVAALYRLLLAVLYRALEGPTDINQAKQYFKQGFPADRITKYLEKWRDRFWLFDDKYPFGQIPGFDPKNWRAWTALAAEHNADNAKVLFDHVGIDSAGAIAPSGAARWLLATQTFSVSCGKSELSHTGTAPSATAAMVIPLGGTLADTLHLSLVPQNKEVTKQDLPIWERPTESIANLKKGMERPAAGLADRYTWRIRSVLLVPNDAGQVGQLAFASGVKIADLTPGDPMLAYRMDKKLGIMPIQLRDRGLWRDFDSLLPDQEQLAPRVIDHSTILAKTDKTRFPRTILVVGQSNDKAKINFWKLERFALPEALLGDRYIRREIQQLLQDAESSERTLWRAASSFARNVLSRGDRKPAPSDIKSFINQMQVIPSYWSKLEATFHDMLGAYSQDRDEDVIRRDWLFSVEQALSDSWRQHSESTSKNDVWSLRALAKSDGLIGKEIHHLNNLIFELASEKEIP